MYAVLKAHIKIGNYEFTQVNNVSISKSIDDLADKAIIKMPTSFLLGNKDTGLEQKELIDSIKTGDKVVITLGYDGIYEGVEFSGYIKSIKPSTPLEIECEDAIYLLRKKTCNKNFIQTDLREILNYIVEGTGVELNADLPKVQFDKFLLKNTNGAKALEKIKEEYGLSIFIDDDGKLFAGLRQQRNLGKKVVYHFQKNTIKNDLKFVSKDDVLLKIKAIAHQKDNSIIEVEAGDSNGELRTLHFYNISSKKQLQQIANDKIDSLKYDGYEGSITGFLVPYANRAMSAELKCEKYPKRQGVYLIEKVVTSFGVNGARRIVYLGNKL